MRIRIDTHNFKTNVGVMQGSMASPAAFNIIAEELVRVIKAKFNSDDITILSYADDFAIIIRKPEFDLTNLIKLIENWCYEQNMHLNKKKCGIMFHKHIPKKSWIYNKSEIRNIPIVDSYKYLGITLQSNLSSELALKQIFDKCRKYTARLFIYNSKIDPVDRIFLFNVFIAPQYDMLAPIFEFFCKTKKEKLTKDWRNFLKRNLLLRNKIENKILDLFIPYTIEEKLKWSMHRLNQKTELRTNPDLILSRPNEYYEAKNSWNIFKSWIKDVEPQDIENLNLLGVGKCTLCNCMMNIGHLEKFHNWRIEDFKTLEGRLKLRDLTKNHYETYPKMAPKKLNKPWENKVIYESPNHDRDPEVFSSKHSLVSLGNPKLDDLPKTHPNISPLKKTSHILNSDSKHKVRKKKNSKSSQSMDSISEYNKKKSSL